MKAKPTKTVRAIANSGLTSALRIFLFSWIALLLMTGTARAVPALQMYAEGATWDAATTSWVVDFSPFKLWVIGNVEQFGPIDIKLSAAVSTDIALAGGSIDLFGTTASGLPSPGDSSTPGDPAAPVLSADGAIPQYDDGHTLSPHGIYGPGVSFFEWSLGVFDKTDSPIGDYNGSIPTNFNKMGQINAYDVYLSGISQVHFDAYGTYKNGKRTFFWWCNSSSRTRHHAAAWFWFGRVRVL